MGGKAGGRAGDEPFDALVPLVLGALTALFERLSLARGLALADGSGRLWVRVGGPRTRRVREALAMAFPTLDASARERLVEGVFVHLARGFVELLLLRGRRRDELLARVEVEGLEHLEAATRASPTGGVLVVSAHLGNWELACAKAAALGVPISVVHHGARGAVPSALFELRGRAGREVGGAPVEQLELGRAGLAVVRALRSGRKVLVLLDQDAKRDAGVFVDFFGRPASTRFGAIALAARRGVPIVPAFIHRGAAGLSHRISIQAPLELEPSAAGDEAALQRSVQRVTAAIEAAIRRTPDQWIWTHRRWRTRPETQPPTRPETGAPTGPAAGAAGSVDESSARSGAERGADGGFAGPRARV